MRRKILIVDDEKNIVDILKYNLKKRGLTPLKPMTENRLWKW